MLDPILVFSILIGSFFLLIKSSDYLVSTSSVLGRRVGISPFVIGLTLVAIGTSLPELFTSIIAIVTSDNSAAFILGTVIGSNISNILLVFGVLLFFSKGFNIRIEAKDIIFLSISTFLIATGVFLGNISIILSTILLFFFILYLYVSVVFGKKKDFIDEAKESEDGFHAKSNTILLLVFFGSLLGLNFAARGVVYSIEELGVLFSIPIEFLTLTTVAFATSLPEIVVTYQTAKKGEYSLGIGNIIGSNVSNVLLIGGFAGLFSEFFSNGLSFVAESFYLSIFMMAGVTLLFVGMLRKKEIPSNYSYLLFVLYAVYLYLVF